MVDEGWSVRAELLRAALVEVEATRDAELAALASHEAALLAADATGEACAKAAASLAERARRASEPLLVDPCDGVAWLRGRRLLRVT